ncbi:DUF2147 domain-containing protein [Olivibacter domesticus]|uniref:DUF2147 domain-containing protein n=1 Tax=Olivibacter domesticus TaxID=407022 RepID=A0A1H7ISR1_OLID1|nr:DUF2147 domain-containing protein [Olivibacter domesticus]SEK64747.1 hypothetical protein SAMN05661044_00799 [Olivibacter domesticus]
MKRILLIFTLAIFSLPVFSQNNDLILGKWQNPSGEGRIEITKKGEKYYGKLYWLKEPNDEAGQPKKDIKNPDEAKRERLVQGLQILEGFTSNGKGIYENGTIYDPKSGKTYSCKMTIKGNDKLDIRGFVGISILGRTETWKRVK